MVIHIAPLPTPSELERLWLLLSATSHHSFFLSWHWIGTWLHCIRDKITPMLLTVTSGQKVVAAAIMVKRTRWRHNVMPIKTWILNATGDPDLDSIYIEHNGILASDGEERGAWSKVLEHLRTVETDWDEIRIDGAPPWLADAWALRQMPVRLKLQSPSRFVNLDDVRAGQGRSSADLLPSRSRTRVRHTKSQVSARYGELSVVTAQTVAQAHQFFTELKALHETRWADSRHGSAFSNPFFETFHREMIDQHFDAGVLQIARISAGSATLGYVYNFVYKNQVLFYQSGIDYSKAMKDESIGLLIHTLLIDHCAQAGFLQYDMLAGDSQYKRSLAPQRSELWWGELQNHRVKLRVEEQARRAYRGFRGASS